MARIHARTRGKSGSKRPLEVDLSLVTLKKKEVEDLVIKLARDELKKPSMIGLILRDTYAVPSVKAVTGKSVTQILKEHDLQSTVPEDLRALTVKADRLRKHLNSNTRDTHNKRGLLLLESKIRRLTKYYKRVGRIPENWIYK